MMYNNFMLKLDFRVMTKHNSIHIAEVLSVQILYIAELIIHTSLLSQHDLVSWPSKAYFAFIVSNAAVRYTLDKLS
jgi:hypothetical protein